MTRSKPLIGTTVSLSGALDGIITEDTLESTLDEHRDVMNMLPKRSLMQLLENYPSPEDDYPPSLKKGASAPFFLARC